MNRYQINYRLLKSQNDFLRKYIKANKSEKCFPIIVDRKTFFVHFLEVKYHFLKIIIVKKIYMYLLPENFRMDVFDSYFKYGRPEQIISSNKLLDFFIINENIKEKIIKDNKKYEFS